MTKPQLPNVPKTLSEETIKELIDVQRAWVSLELKQTEIALKEIEHSGKVADKSITAQAEDRKDAREKQVIREKNGYIFAAFALLIIAAFAGTALYFGKEAVVLDILKVLAGFAGGYGVSQYSAAKKQRSTDSSDDSE